jgi:GAF domain-containing protein
MKAQKGTSEGLASRCEDLLEIARLVSWCMNRDYLIKNCLNQLSRRLGLRARCALWEGDELKLHCWVGVYECPIPPGPICRESIVWKVVQEGKSVNLTDPRQTDGYRHTLPEPVKIKAIIPLWYADALSQEEKRIGALIVDSGKKGVPISKEDFEYLKVVGELMGSAVGKIQLAEKLVESYRNKEAILKETSHFFRNRIAAIGGLSRRMARLGKSSLLAKEARRMYQEAQELEGHLERFEKYMET